MRDSRRVSLGALGVGIALCAAAPGYANSAPRVAIESGALSGLSADGVDRFLGVPFAAPPTGDLRWRAPRAPLRWKGVRPATTFGPACAQNGGFGVFAAPSSAEDCLTLNVFAPATKSTGPRPVMVWIYGGAHYSGNAADYDGSALAREGDVIVVTLNYRLGAFGFFSHPAITEGTPGHVNFGLLDQRAALEWVRRNIARFGGDPANVTLFGQSAGGSSTLAALVAPSFGGLFHRAIIQSGGRLVTTTADAARAKGEALGAKLGCAPGDGACLRNADTSTILAAQDPHLAGVTLDNALLTRAIGPALEAGAFHRVPIMIGVTKDEQAFTLAAREMADGPQTVDGYRRSIATTFGADNVDKVFARYPIGALDPSRTEVRTWHGARGCISRWIARATSGKTPTFVYEFTDDSAPSYFPAMSFPMGAYHTAELQYLFPLYRGGLGTAHALDEKQSALALAMRAYWTSFAHGGVPGGPVGWPAFGADERVMVLGQPIALESGYGAKRDCDFWDGVIRYR